MQKVRAEVNSQIQVVDPFQGLTLPGRTSTDIINNDLVARPYQVWLGYVTKYGLEETYIQERDKLADAAYVGDWSSVKECVHLGEQMWGESWANAFRLRRYCPEAA